MLRLPDRWVWDLWVARTDSEYHLFFLQAPRSLGDPDLRHRNASVGHAVSTDLSSWTILPDALLRGPAGAWDDLATWTGSVIAHGDTWYMLYTGISSVDGGLVQRIGLATSSDLVTWTKHPSNPVMVADTCWYEGPDPGASRECAWRDPWILHDPAGHGFHALITARVSGGRSDERGVIGHARSPDLISWTVMPPLSAPGEFAQLEVPQVETVDGGFVLVFSARAEDFSEQRRRRQGALTATFVCPAPSLLGPFDPAAAREVTAPSLYSGRLTQRHDGSWVMLGFLDSDPDGGFVGEITDPIPLGRLGDAEFGSTTSLPEVVGEVHRGGP
jgi:beta-fructofuranosidase